MKYFILIFLLSSKVFAFTDRELIEQLSQIHGSQWSESIKNYGMDVIRSKLKHFLQSPDSFSFWNKLEESEKDNIYRNGISEFGNFVLKEGVKISRSDFNFLMGMTQTFHNDWTSRGALSWYVALKNTASSQGMDALIDIFEQVPVSEIATKYTLIRMMVEMLVPPSENQTDESLDYQVYGKNRVEPQLQVEYQSGALKKLYSPKLKSLISEFLNNSASNIQSGEIKVLLQGFIRDLTNQKNDEKQVVMNEFTMNNTPNDSVNPNQKIEKSGFKNTKMKKISRNLASDSENENQNTGNSYIGYFLILMLPLFIGYFFYNKKR